MNVIKNFWKRIFGRDRAERLFVILAIAFPLVQFILFYICVNFNQLILSFQKYEGMSEVPEWAGLENYKLFFNNLLHTATMGIALRNSLIFWGMSVVSLFVGMIVAYMWWKEPPCHGFFKFIALLPSLISVTVFIMLYRYTITDMLPTLFNEPKIGELFLPPQGLWTVLIVGTLLGAGPTWVMLLGAINNIPQALVEYSKLEGVNSLQEVRYLVFPFLYPTLTSYLIVGLSGLFANYGQLISFYNMSAASEIQTLGYYFFVQVFNSTTLQSYPYAAAAGMTFSVVTFALVMVARKLLDKLGPSEV